MRISKERIREAITDQKVKVISFDVFDTLLLRPFWNPTDLFYFLNREATELISAGDEIHFSEYRTDAENRARIRAALRGAEDIDIQEIYDILEEDDLLPKNVVRALMKKELELEERFCYPRKSAKALMEFAVSAGKRVVVISDMYLPAAFIESLLEKNGFPKPERVFVSGETGRSKRTGHLYQDVLDKLGIQREEILHIGDNPVSDIQAPQKIGIRAIPYYRTIDLLSGKNQKACRGKAFQYAYDQIRSPFSNSHSLDKLGVRCMLAVAANRIYDDPFRDFNKTGEYAGDELLFGTFALGLYSMAQALWMDGLASESEYDHVVFFSRDGYLPYLGFCLIQKLREKDGAFYARISRRAILPMILSTEERLAIAGSYANYKTHSPRSLTDLLLPVLIKDAAKTLEKELNDRWSDGFTSEVEMMQYLKLVYSAYVDRQKMEDVVTGFRNYFRPLMSGKVLTYDVGYNLKNEIMLHSFFPDAKMTAAFTHSTNDLAMKRSKLANIHIKQFYSSVPYVSWAPRELFLTENAPSCIGYSPEGEAVLGASEKTDNLLQNVQNHAIAYMEQFVSVFKKDLLWLPVEPVDACLPFEAFLHSPTIKDRRWVAFLDTENSADSGLKTFQCQEFWQKLRLVFWIASRHPNRPERDLIKFAFFLLTDRSELQKAFERRLPASIKFRLKNRELPLTKGREMR